MYDAMDPQYVDESVFYVPKSRESEYRRKHLNEKTPHQVTPL